MLRTSHFPRRRAAVATAIAALMFLAGCGASDDSPSQSAPTGAAAEQVAAAKKAYEPFLATPTSPPITTPLDVKPEPGKTFVWITCETGCPDIANGIKSALAAVGWNYKEIFADLGDPATFTAALKEALQYDPTAVAVAGIPPEAGWQTVIPEYEEAGVPIITTFLTTSVESPALVGPLGGEAAHKVPGELLANWFIADSGGKGTVVLQGVPDLPTLAVMAETFTKTVEEGCADCKIVNLDQSIADVQGNKLTDAAVSALRVNPDASYLFSVNTSFNPGLDAALSAAGLSDKIKFFGALPTAGQMQDLKLNKGVAKAFWEGQNRYGGVAIVDVALRLDQKMELDPNEFMLPTHLIVAGGDFDPDYSFGESAEFLPEFKKLWHVE